MPALSSRTGVPETVDRAQRKAKTAPKTPTRTPVQRQTIQAARGPVSSPPAATSSSSPTTATKVSKKSRRAVRAKREAKAARKQLKALAKQAPETLEAMVQKRSDKLYRQLKRKTDIRGKAPDIELDTKLTPDINAYVTGKKRVNISKETAKRVMSNPGKLRQKGQRVLTHEIAHVGQARAGFAKNNEAKREAYAERYAQLATRKRGKKYRGTGTTRESVIEGRKLVKTHIPNRKVVGGQFENRRVQADRDRVRDQDRTRPKENPKVQGPQEKKVARKLKVAAKKSQPTVTSPNLGPRQTEFVNQLAKRTGLSPRVLAGMAASEQPADSPSVEGSDNWLNIGYYDSGPGGPTQDPRFFSGPKKAANTTAKFLKGKTLGASEGIQNILSTAGKSEAEQIAAIQNSGWASSGHPNLPALTEAASEKGGKPIPPKLKAKAKDVLGAQATRKTIKKARSGGSTASPAPKQLKGPLGGSREMVRQIVGSKVKGDHGTKNEGSVHSPTGDHYGPGSYAQDINQPGGNKAEGEPAYNQATLDKMVANLRKQGADVPDLKIGENWEGVVKGYRIQLLTNEGGTVNHIHIGAEWQGTPTTTGSYSGAPAGAAVSSSSAVSGAPTASGSTSTTGRRKKVRRRKGKERQRQIREALVTLGSTYPALDPRDYQVTSSYKAPTEISLGL